MKCYRCGGKGHMQGDCATPEYYNDKRKKKRYDESHRANNAKDDSDDERGEEDLSGDDSASVAWVQPVSEDVTVTLTASDSMLTSTTSELPLESSFLCIENALTAAWILDAGATCHHTGDRSLLHNVRKLQRPRKTRTTNGESVITEVGDAVVCVGDTTMTLTDVLFVPASQVNLVSVSQLTDNGCVVRIARRMPRWCGRERRYSGCRASRERLRVPCEQRETLLRVPCEQRLYTIRAQRVRRQQQQEQASVRQECAHATQETAETQDNNTTTSSSPPSTK